MSIIPPTDIIKSKLLYFLRKKITDNEEFNALKLKLDPFPIFRLQIQFKSTEETPTGDAKESYGTITKVSSDDLLNFIEGEEPYSKKLMWDDIDAAVFMYKRCIKPAKEHFSARHGQLRFSLQSTYDTSPEITDNWSDIFVDEIILNQSNFFPASNK